MAQEVPADLTERMAERFAGRVIEHTNLPVARTEDFRASCEVAVDGPLLRVTCTITGSSYECSWDGRDETALALADEAAESTAYLVTKSGHYDWLRSKT